MFEEADVPPGVFGVDDIAMPVVVWDDCSVLLPVEAVGSWLIFAPSVGGFCDVDDCCPPPVCGSLDCPCCAGWLLLFSDPEVL